MKRDARARARTTPNRANLVASHSAVHVARGAGRRVCGKRKRAGEKDRGEGVREVAQVHACESWLCVRGARSDVGTVRFVWRCSGRKKGQPERRARRGEEQREAPGRGETDTRVYRDSSSLYTCGREGSQRERTYEPEARGLAHTHSFRDCGGTARSNGSRRRGRRDDDDDDYAAAAATTTHAYM